MADVLVAARVWKEGAEEPPLDVRTWPAVPAGRVVKTPPVVVTTGKCAVALIAPALVMFPCAWLLGALPLAVPVKLAVIVPAEKFPLASRATMALAVLAFVAVVAELATFPVVLICASFVSTMAALAEMSALTMPLMVAASTSWWMVAGVTSSPLVKVLPLVMVAMG